MMALGPRLVPSARSAVIGVITLTHLGAAGCETRELSEFSVSGVGL